MVRKRTILLIEDEKDMAEVMRDVFLEKGYWALSARNGRGGMALLKAIHVDVVVLDLFMPEMDGFEFVRQMRQEGFSQPVLVVTAGTKYDVPSDLAFILKPFGVDELYEAVDRLFEDTDEAGDGTIG